MGKSFRQQYDEIICPALIKKGGYVNRFSVPKLEKIVLNMGLGKRLLEKGALEAATEGLADIAGQRPCITYAKKSIASFKVREGMQLGLKVTLRGNRMYEFFQRLLVIAMPRIRDFRGVSSKSFDGCGNFSLGIKEHSIFPEIKYDKISDILGMDIIIVTTASTDKEGKLLLEEFGMPFQN
jgi:large subunit ribosomal protein L5